MLLLAGDSDSCMNVRQRGIRFMSFESTIRIRQER
jgi:hypothetical protein